MTDKEARETMNTERLEDILAQIGGRMILCAELV